MRILITNDDGINAPGLIALETIARALSDDVWVVAPETDQSGKAHSVTLSDPVRFRAISERRFAVAGTPTDCVIMGVRRLVEGKRPDLVLSGVNRGANIADDVTYSGTVAGAIEGTLLGIQSIALSQAYGWQTKSAPRWDCAEAHGPVIINRLLAAAIPKGAVMNVNFPDRAPDAVSGVEVTVQGARNLDMIHVDEREDGRGNPYFWINYKHQWHDPEVGTDLWALDQGAISVTPLRLDLTDHGLRQQLQHAMR